MPAVAGGAPRDAGETAGASRVGFYPLSAPRRSASDGGGSADGEPVNGGGANDNEATAGLARWRAHLVQTGAVAPAELDEREREIVGEIGALSAAGLDGDEAFLVALRRTGERDAATREFARHHAAQLLDRPAAERRGRPGLATGTWVALGLAAVAAAAAKILQSFGPPLAEDAIAFYARNEALVTLACVAGYFGWKRRPTTSSALRIGAAFLAAALLTNGFPFTPAGATEALTALHLPIALWLAVGIAYAGGRWRVSADRMRFVRFSGELFIHGVLIALGGMVLSAVTLILFGRIGVDADRLWAAWVLPCGAAGAVVVAAWLADTRTHVAGNLAPALARIFTPLFAFALLALLLTMAWTRTGIRIEREVLIVLDLLLAVVVGLVLYAVSARTPGAGPRSFDALQLLLVALALLLDLLALGAIGARIVEFGFTPNRMAALGLNLILLANLAGSAWFYGRFLRGRAHFAALERWQTAFLPVYAGWAAIVAAVFPPLFEFA